MSITDTTSDPTRARSFRPKHAELLGTGTTRPGWDLATERRLDDGRTLARNIAWFSIGLGVAEVAVPDRIGEYLGMEDRTRLIQLYGLREIAKGVGILSQRTPTGWLWARVAGDALDLATLATGLGSDNPKRGNVMKAMAAVAGVTALDLLCAGQLSRSTRAHQPEVRH
jgi:hypothetical protein